MKKMNLINPNTVISVDPLEKEKIVDNFFFLCKLTTKETVLTKYNPLTAIKQYIGVKWCIVSDRGTDISIAECIEYIDYYGTYITSIKDDVMSEYDIHEYYETKEDAEKNIEQYKTKIKELMNHN